MELMARMGVLNLAHCRSGGQEQMRQCKLATTYLVTSIVQFTRFSVPLHLIPQPLNKVIHPSQLNKRAVTCTLFKVFVSSLP